DAPLVGREIELELLEGLFRKSLQDQVVQLITIVGEPGIGKTRLIREFARVLQGESGLDVRWRRGRCLSYGDGVVFWALGEIVKAEAGILENDTADAVASKVDALVPDAVPDALWIRQRIRPLVAMDAPPATSEENFAAWRAFLESLALERPSVFVFEDMH